MIWFVAWIVTGCVGLVAALALAASAALGLPGPPPWWGTPALLVAETVLFIVTLWVTRQKLQVAIARPESTGISPPIWLVIGAEWFAESRPLWLLPFAAIAAAASFIGCPLLIASSSMAAIWGVVALLPVTLAAAALLPDGAHRLADPFSTINGIKDAQ